MEDLQGEREMMPLWMVLRKFSGSPSPGFSFASPPQHRRSQRNLGPGRQKSADKRPETVHKKREMDRKTLCEISK